MTWFTVPSCAGNVNALPEPSLSPSIVNVPFKVVFPFLSITKASLFKAKLISGWPLPITNKRSVDTQLSADPET